MTQAKDELEEQIWSDEVIKASHEILALVTPIIDAGKPEVATRAKDGKQYVLVDWIEIAKLIRTREKAARLDEWQKFIEFETGENGRMATLKAQLEHREQERKVM